MGGDISFAEGIPALVAFGSAVRIVVRGLGYATWLGSLGYVFPFWHKPCVVTLRAFDIL